MVARWTHAIIKVRVGLPRLWYHGPWKNVGCDGAWDGSSWVTYSTHTMQYMTLLLMWASWYDFLEATQCLLLYFWKMPLASFSGAKSPHTGDIFPRQSRKKTQKLTFLRFNFWKHWKGKKSPHSRNRSILLTVGELMTAFVMDLLPHRDYSQNNCYETNRPCFRQLHEGVMQNIH